MSFTRTSHHGSALRRFRPPTGQENGEERCRAIGRAVRRTLSVAAFRAALDVPGWEDEPLERATTQARLGIVLRLLGSREVNAARFREAVMALRRALEDVSREREPYLWSQTQMDLGITLAALAELDGSSTRLEEALVAQRAALEERPRERVPLK